LSQKKKDLIKALSVDQAIVLAQVDENKFATLLKSKAFSDYVQMVFNMIAPLFDLDAEEVQKILSEKEMSKVIKRHPAIIALLQQNWFHDRQQITTTTTSAMWPSSQQDLVTLRTGLREIKVSRQLLEHISAYFSALALTSTDGGDEAIDIIDLTDGELRSLDVLATLMRHELPTVKGDNLVPLLKISQYYDIPILRDVCENFLLERGKIPRDALRHLKGEIGDAAEFDTFERRIAFCRLYALDKMKWQILREFADTHSDRETLRAADHFLFQDERASFRQRVKEGVFDKVDENKPDAQ
jgi:hypothetical protein